MPMATNKIRRPTCVSGVKLGGFPEEIFLNLSEKERGLYECSICYLMLNDGRQCRNRHRFCTSCIYAWCMSNQINNDRCPVCRVKDRYIKCEEINTRLAKKLVRCHAPACFWKGLLSDFLLHKHGYEKYNNEENYVELPDIAGARRLSQQHTAPTQEFNNPQHQTITRENMYSFDITGERARREMRFGNMRAQINYGRQRLQSMMSDFGDKLEERRQSLISHQHDQTRDRLDNLNEVCHLEVRLNKANSNLTSLFSNKAQLMAKSKAGIANGRQTPVLLRNELSIQPIGEPLDSRLQGKSQDLQPDTEAVTCQSLKQNNLRNIDWSAVRPKKP